MDLTRNVSTMTDESTHVEQGFTAGRHVVLRPVLDSDLEELWPILAQNPYEYEPLPWTHQRLKQKFEDKEELGLWGSNEKYYAVVRSQGGLVGFLREEGEGNPRITWNTFHLGAAIADREELYRDLLTAFRAYHERWSHALRISFITGGSEREKHSALEASGYAKEIVFERSHYYLGELADEMVHTWCSAEIEALGTDDGPVAGEEG
jgi:hypothetical protein